jgi:hypothetical protein
MEPVLTQTMEAFSSQGDGTLTVIKEKDSLTFEVEQNVKTMPSAKTMTIDTKTNHILLIGAEFGPPPAPLLLGNGRVEDHWSPALSRFWKLANNQPSA